MQKIILEGEAHSLQLLMQFARQLGVKASQPTEPPVVSPREFYAQFQFSAKTFQFNREEANER